MSVLRGHYLTGCFAYAADHQARLPPDLQTLVDQRYLGAIEYDLPGKDIILRPALLQAGQILNELPPQTIVLSETQAFTNACLVIRADGSSKLLSPQDYQAEMNANGPSPEAVVTPPPDGRPGAGGAGP